MNDPISDPTHPSASADKSSELTELRELCEELRWQAHTLRVALLIVTVVVSAFFWLEGRRSSQALTQLRPQAAQALQAAKAQDPIINRFVGQLVEFGKTHPDFKEILKKYSIQVTSTQATAPAPASPKK